MEKSQDREGHRRAMGYEDRNDGFLRSLFSRSKNRLSRIRKLGKPVREKPPHRRGAGE